MTLSLGTEILQCFDSILTAVEALPPTSTTSTTSRSGSGIGGGIDSRKLQTGSVDSTATVDSALSLMASLKDMMLLGEALTSPNTLTSVSYYIEKGWPFRLADSGAEIFPSSTSSHQLQQQSAAVTSTSVGAADFQTAADLFTLSLASLYSVELFSINGLEAATCEHDLDPCSLVGSFDSNQHVLTLVTAESSASLGLLSTSLIQSSVPLSYNVQPSLTPEGSATPYEMTCPALSGSSTTNVSVTCDAAATLGPAEEMSVECSSTVQGDWGGDCPLYATDVLCGTLQGVDISGSNTCYSNATTASHSTCVCDITPVVTVTASGESSYMFDVSTSLMLGRNRIEAGLASLPVGSGNGGGSSNSNDVWWVILYIAIGLFLICLIYLIVWCIFRCMANADEKDEKVVYKVEKLHAHDDEESAIELAQKHKDDGLKTSFEIRFAHNYSHAHESCDENCYRTAKSYFQHAIEVSREDKATGAPSIEPKSVAMCYLEYAEVLEHLGESKESVAMYKKAYVLDNGLLKTKNDPNKPRTLGELKLKLTSALEDGPDNSPQDEHPAMFDVFVSPPQDMNGHVWQSKFCENDSFCQLCKGFINGETEKDQSVYQCGHCELFGHRDCIVLETLPTCTAQAAAVPVAAPVSVPVAAPVAAGPGLFATLSTRAKGMFAGNQGSGEQKDSNNNKKKKKDKESGYNTLVGGACGGKPYSDDDDDDNDSYHSEDLEHQPDMTNLYSDDTNDVNYTTIEHKVDATGRKSVALQSVKISNPASKPKKSILKQQWEETDAYSGSTSQPEGPPRAVTPPPPLLSHKKKLLHQESNSSDISPPPTPDLSPGREKKEKGTVKEKEKEKVKEKEKDKEKEKTGAAGNKDNLDGLTTYEITSRHQTDDFNL